LPIDVSSALFGPLGLVSEALRPTEQPQSTHDLLSKGLQWADETFSYSHISIRGNTSSAKSSRRVFELLVTKTIVSFIALQTTQIVNLSTFASRAASTPARLAQRCAVNNVELSANWDLFFSAACESAHTTTCCDSWRQSDRSDVVYACHPR